MDEVKTLENSIEKNSIPEPRTKTPENIPKTNLNSEKSQFQLQDKRKRTKKQIKQTRENKLKPGQFNKQTNQSNRHRNNQSEQSETFIDYQNDIIVLTNKKQVIRQHAHLTGSSILKNIKNRRRTK